MAVAYGMPTSALIQRSTPERDFVPANFAEMYQHYYVYVLKLLVQQGIPHQDADDFAQVLFIKMSEKGLLESFDPQRAGSNGRPAVFSTMLSGFVLKYAMGFRKRQAINSRREPNLVDQPTSMAQRVGPDSSGMNSWIDVWGPIVEDEYTDLHDEDFRCTVREALSEASTGRRDTRLDLVALFNEIDRQVMEDGRYDTGVLAEMFGVSRTTIHKWLEKLRAEVSRVRTDRG